MQQSKRIQRERGSARDPSKVKPKFQEQRELEVKANPIRAMNPKQEKYIELIATKTVVIATGYPGSSKTYLPTALAADAFKLGSINRIIFTRPAISSSKSIGYFSGSIEEKLSPWLGAVIPILKERLGKGALEVALESGDIEFVPLEVTKGLSLNDCFFMVEEASDLTKAEVINLITRMGKNSTLVLAGDIGQSALKESSGLSWLKDFVQRHKLPDFGFIDFNEVSDIVRSTAVRKFITALDSDKEAGFN